jgi:hypothetical protein
MSKRILRSNEWTLATRLLFLGIAGIGSFPAASLGQLLFVTNPTAGTIGEYDATTGAAINPSLITGLDQPGAIAVSGSDIFVCSINSATTTGIVGEYTTSGQTVKASLISGFDYPTNAIAISGSNLFVDSGAFIGSPSGEIGEYTTSGGTVKANFIDGLSYGIDFSGSNLIVSQYDDTGGGTVDEYNATGGFVTTLAGGLKEPMAIAVAGSGVFVSAGEGVGEYSISDPNPGMVIGGINGNGPSGVTGMAVLGSDLFTANGRVGEYTTSGGTVNSNLIPGLTGAYGIAVVVPEPGGVCLLGFFALPYLTRRRRAEYDMRR